MDEEETRAPRSWGALVALITALSLALAGFAALGAWQLQRMGWKHDLIARVARHQNAAPGPAPAAQDWPRLTPQADEYRPIRIRGRFHHGHATLVHASTALGTGFWVLTPLQAEDGHWVLINRGFVPSNRELPSADQAGERGAEVVGLLRFSEPEGAPLRANDPARQRWFSRDVAAMAAAVGLPAEHTAPYFLDAVSEPVDSTAPAPTPAPASAAGRQPWPRPGLTVLQFSDNHLVYAVTWFALAVMAACGIGYIVADESRLRRLAGERGERHRGPAGA